MLADSIQQITLLFYNTSANTPGCASIDNTGGFLVPTLEPTAIPLTGPIHSLTWAGTANGHWDANIANWKANLASPSTSYNQADDVTFDDTLAGTSTINLVSVLAPGSVTVSSSAANYTFSGSGTMTLAGANSYSGATYLNAGKLILNGLDSGGGSLAGSGGTTLAGSGTNNGPVVVSGALQPGDAKDRWHSDFGRVNAERGRDGPVRSGWLHLHGGGPVWTASVQRPLAGERRTCVEQQCHHGEPARSAAGRETVSAHHLHRRAERGR